MHNLVSLTEKLQDHYQPWFEILRDEGGSGDYIMQMYWANITANIDITMVAKKLIATANIDFTELDKLFKRCAVKLAHGIIAEYETEKDAHS